MAPDVSDKDERQQSTMTSDNDKDDALSVLLKRVDEMWDVTRAHQQSVGERMAKVEGCLDELREVNRKVLASMKRAVHLEQRLIGIERRLLTLEEALLMGEEGA